MKDYETLSKWIYKWQITQEGNKNSNNEGQDVVHWYSTCLAHSRLCGLPQNAR